MPYVDSTSREKLSDLVNRIHLTNVASAGELNYIITNLILTFIETRGVSYQTYNDVVGALENCKLELYRREIITYEEQKRKENGDVY